MYNFSSILPTQDHIVVVPLDMKNKKTDGGIVVISDIEDRRNIKGIVVAVGQGRKIKDSEKFIPMEVQVNDIVLMSTNAGIKTRLENIDCIIVREEDIFATFEN